MRDGARTSGAQLKTLHRQPSGLAARWGAAAHFKIEKAGETKLEWTLWTLLAVPPRARSGTSAGFNAFPLLAPPNVACVATRIQILALASHPPTLQSDSLG